VNNETMKMLDEALKDTLTPSWGRALLMVLRDDHRALHRHLLWHTEAWKTIQKVTLPIMSFVVLCLAVALLKWLPTILP